MKPQLAEDERPPATLSLREYLTSIWHPDCDFVDGQTEDRNVGSLDHSIMIRSLLWMLTDKREPWELMALPSLRMCVAPTRIRVPDICVIQRNNPREKILTHPPLIATEILDNEDRAGAMLEKLDDYCRFGIEHVWLVNPMRCQAHRNTFRSLEEVRSGELTVPGTPIRIVLSELFAELDQA